MKMRIRSLVTALLRRRHFEDAMRTAIKGRFKDPGLWAAYALTVGDLNGV